MAARTRLVATGTRKRTNVTDGAIQSRGLMAYTRKVDITEITAMSRNAERVAERYRPPHVRYRMHMTAPHMMSMAYMLA